MSTTTSTTSTALWTNSATRANSQDKSDRIALLRGNSPSASATMNYGSCGGPPASASLQRPTILTDINGEAITSIEELVAPPQQPQPPQPQQAQQPIQPKKATLLSLAAKAAASPDSATPSAARLDDIVRKGIDIAREFDASAFTGRPNVIKLVVADNASGGSRRQSMFEWASGVSESDVHVVIEMPPDDYTIPEDEPTSGGGSADVWNGRWQRRRQRNHSDSSKTPLISDA